ncbi:MAG: Flp pilus assembly protein CpaB [Solirubrobacteraceae bacterium]
MSRRRRAALLLGLAVVLGTLAATDVARREAALERRLGPPVPVLVARDALGPGTELSAGHVALRRVPARYAPVGALSSLADVVGLRVAVPVTAGAYLSAGELSGTPGGRPDGGLRPGERMVDIVAVGTPELVTPGGRVDVLVSREGDRGDTGRTVLALEDVEVLDVAPATGSGSATGPAADAPRLRASLRVTLRQAVYLAAAQSFARELRLLPRAPGDDRRGAAGLTVDGNL